MFTPIPLRAVVLAVVGISPVAHRQPEPTVAVEASTGSSIASDALLLTCNYFQEFADGSSHYFNLPGSCSGGWNCFDCQSWNNCHSSFQSGRCSAWHDSCGFVRVPVAQEMERRLATGDIARIRDYIRSNPQLIELNFARRSLQVLGCGDGVIANLPLSSDEMHALLE